MPHSRRWWRFTVAMHEELRGRLRGLPLKRAGFAVLLHGEPGIGKTHAVTQLLRGAPCASVTLSATTPGGVLRALPRPKRFAPWLAAVFERVERNEFVPDETLTAAALGWLSSLAPFVLCLEDLHEASKSDFFGALAAGVARARGVALLLTSREIPAFEIETVALEPLTTGETKALLEAEVSAPLPLEVLEWISARAAGNPLFTLEFFRHLARFGFAWSDGKRWHWRDPNAPTMPATVEALIERTLNEATRTPQEAALVATTALLPADASPEFCAAVADLDVAVLPRLRAELCVRGVFAVNGGFVHPLYREVARAQPSLAQRQRYARRAVAWCAHAAPEHAVAFVKDAGLEPGAALAVFEAGIAALHRAGRRVDAARLLYQSLELRPPEARPACALLALRDLCEVDFVASSALLEVAAGLRAPAPLEDAVFLAEQLAQRRREADALALLERLTEGVQDRWLEWRVGIAALAGNHAGVLELIDAHPTLLHTCQTRTLERIVHVLAGTGRSREALEAGEEALALRLEPPERVGLLQVTAVAALYQGQFARAIDLWSQALGLAITHDLGAAAMKITINRAQALVRVGDTARAEEDLVRASALAARFGERRVHLQSLVMLGVTLTERAAFERAETALLEALAMVPQGVSPELRVNAEFALTELYRVWEFPQAQHLMYKYARSALGHACETNNPMLVLSAMIGASSAELRVGHARAALELAEETLALARSLERAFPALSALRCRAAALGALGDVDAAVTTWQEAVTAAEALNLPLHAQENRLEIDHLTRDLVGARERLAWFETHNHPLEARKARTYFPELAQAPSPADANEPQMRLEVLGAMRLGQTPVRGRKRQALLAALLESRLAGRAQASKLELIDALYPDADEDQAANALKETVRLVRAAFGAEIIQTTPQGYALGAIDSDAQSFLERPFETSSALWRGAYLEGLDVRDEQVSESLHGALAQRVRALIGTDPKEALRLAALLLERDPYNLDHLRLHLSALRSNANFKSLKRSYTQARARFAEVGDALPERWQDFLPAA